jgi:hypothetical protein
MILVSDREEGMDWEIQNLAGIIFQAIFQRKCFKRWFSLSFQRAFQQDLGRGEGVEGEKKLMRWCVDLVEKTPVVDGVQRRESEWERIVNFKISKVVVEFRKKCKIFCFQDMVGAWIRSEMAKGRFEGIEDNLGIGLNDGDVGIHGVDHIERLELLWRIKQVPADMIGRVALIPFQIQEPDVRGEDKKLPYLMYFYWKREIHKLLWFESSFYPNFDIRDKFTSFISLNPRLPWSFLQT